MDDVSTEMPCYKCHKEVHALKIIAVMGDAIIPEQGFTPFKVSREYLEKHKPEAGGYYVVYADGYKSFSPAEAFESGYTRI